MQQDQQAKAISAAMHSLEDGVDMEIVQAAQLMALMADYRVEADMDAATGQKALARMADAQKHLIEARMKVVAAHASVADAFEVHNVWPYECPDASAKVTELKLVSE
ncbi:MAG: hypothetical protein ABJ242_01250 [Marinomonas sp.]